MFSHVNSSPTVVPPGSTAQSGAVASDVPAFQITCSIFPLGSMMLYPLWRKVGAFGYRGIPLSRAPGLRLIKFGSRHAEVMRLLENKVVCETFLIASRAVYSTRLSTTRCSIPEVIRPIPSTWSRLLWIRLPAPPTFMAARYGYSSDTVNDLAKPQPVLY